MQQCTGCKEIKPFLDFHKKQREPTGFDTICKDCKNKHHNEWCHKNDYCKKRRDKRKPKVLEIRNWVKELKNAPCTDCGRSYDSEVMDFDHIRDKEHSVSYLTMIGYKKEKILEEIEKCELVCANCHRKRTWNRQNHPERSDSSKEKLDIIRKAKNVPCAMCGEKYEHYIMHLDHIDPSKKLFGLARIVTHSKEEIIAEIAKCQVLCNNCHRIKSKQERTEGVYKNMNRPKEEKKPPRFYTGEFDKECSHCHVIRPNSMFSKKANCLDRTCKICQREARIKVRPLKPRKIRYIGLNDRECYRCGEIKNNSEYYKNKKTGIIYTDCKECTLKRREQYK